MKIGIQEYLVFVVDNIVMFYQDFSQNQQQNLTIQCPLSGWILLLILKQFSPD